MLVAGDARQQAQHTRGQPLREAQGLLRGHCRQTQVNLAEVQMGGQRHRIAAVRAAPWRCTLPSAPLPFVVCRLTFPTSRSSRLVAPGSPSSPLSALGSPRLDEPCPMNRHMLC